MKAYMWIAALVMTLAIALVGCGKKDEVDTAKLQKSFATADQKISSTINQAIVDIQSDDFSAALEKLKQVAADTKLTPEQQQSIKDTIAQVTKKIAAAANKTVTDIQKSLPK